jgi:hypothetical protein
MKSLDEIATSPTTSEGPHGLLIVMIVVPEEPALNGAMISGAKIAKPNTLNVTKAVWVSVPFVAVTVTA